MEGVVSELLAASLSSRFRSSLISSCMGVNVGTSFFLDDADVLLASRWMHKSFSVFWPSRLKTLRPGFGPPLVSSSPAIQLVLQALAGGLTPLHSELWMVRH